ncbi:rhamnogalacturonan lyase family protein [Algoriphagus yeomjeoni]|uniref:Rhamnogalacturonan lyase family 11 C-terminal domain-containing protein n=1 Tax=Algoriphagus yeomjeoni TaxID=291403 RepID=A0A327PGR6_9BACT|nr:hypothetical protein [Algoriphagus yeomjeoni]RAI91419.1 hypothetical protein LV83_01604 [Algoriphagus yeomjeoni]
MIKLNLLFITTFLLLLPFKVNANDRDHLFIGEKDIKTDTIIVPASDFLYELPKGDIIANSWALREEWVFNNTAIVLNSLSNLLTHITVAQAGDYYLFVRSKGKPNSSFKVAVNDQVTTSIFGNDSLMTWKQGERFKLLEGKNVVKITRINAGAAFDVLAFTKAPSLEEKELKQFELNPDVKLLKEYSIPASNSVKFGDLNGDNLTDFVVFTRDYSAHAFDQNGKELWTWEAPEEYRRERSEFEAPGVIWDFDQDGKAELVHWRMTGEKEWLVIADGQSGEVIRQTEWPTNPLPHVYNNFRLAIGKLTAGDPNEVVVFTDMGGTIRVDAYDSKLTRLWNHTENRKKDNLGHYVYPVDLNEDGMDEVLVGSLLLDSDGKELWNRFDLLGDNHDHADNYKFADINGDGKRDILTANSETGVFMYEGLTGEIIWQNIAEHSQQIESGNFLKGQSEPQVVVGARTYGNRQAGEQYLWSQLYWFSKEGEMLFKWPQKPINGNPDFVKGDWLGNGQDQLFWFKFFINEEGKGDLYFPDPVFHMFDFTGDGAEEVITLDGRTLRVFGAKNPQVSKDKKEDLNYLKHKVVNHTHY